MSENNNCNTRRIVELDSFRGIASLGVAIYHYGEHFAARPLELLLSPFYRGGFLLVDFFFVLSGYVVARAFWRFGRQSDFLGNVWRRVARMFPLHFLMLLVVCVLAWSYPNDTPYSALYPKSNDLKHFLLNLFLINQIGLQSGWSFNTPSWSISTEMVSNVLFLAFIALSARLRILAVLLSTLIGFFFFLRAGLPIIQGKLAFGFLDLNLLRCILGFTTGVLIHWALSQWLGIYDLMRQTRFSTFNFLVGSIGLVILMSLSHRHPPISHYLMSIFLSALVVLGSIGNPRFSSPLRVPALEYLGKISYSTYLVHYPLQMLVYSLILNNVIAQPALGSTLTLVVYVTSVIIVSSVTYYVVEAPMQRYMQSRFDRARFSHRNSTKTSP